MDVTRFVDTSGDLPSLRAGALASTLVGTVVYGWLYGFIGFFDTILGGLASIPERLGRFATDATAGVFGMFAAPVAAAWESNAAWIGTLGVFGIVVAILEVAVVIWIVLLVVERTIRWVRVITP